MKRLAEAPVPPKLADLLSRTRAQFFGDIGQVYEKSMEPIAMIMKGLMLDNEALKQQLSQQAPPPPQGAPPNRQARRAAERVAKKAAKKKGVTVIPDKT